MYYGSYPIQAQQYPLQPPQNTLYQYMPQQMLQPQQMMNPYGSYNYYPGNGVMFNQYAVNANPMNNYSCAQYSTMPPYQPKAPQVNYIQPPVQRQQPLPTYCQDFHKAPTYEIKKELAEFHKLQSHTPSKDADAKKKRKKIGKPYQDTKNIPKNYTKAILKYIKQNEVAVEKLMDKQYSYKAFIKKIELKKDKVISIKVFKSLFFTESDDPEQREFCRVFRIMAFKFLREDFVQYIYNNKKIKQAAPMLKYLNVVLKGLQEPKTFSSWKLDSQNEYGDSTYIDSTISTMDD